MEREESGFRGSVCGEIGCAEVAEDGRYSDNCAASFGQHVREECAEGGEVREGVDSESSSPSVNNIARALERLNILLDFFRRRLEY